MTAPQPLVQLLDVAKRYGGEAGSVPVEVLRGVNLTVAPGDSIAIVGPSGSGKTTLLNIVGTLDEPTSGRALIEGVDLMQMGERQRAAHRNRRVGFVFQTHHLLPQCTALENVLVPTLASKEGRGAAPERARQLLERVGLGPRIDHRPGALSGGECQRVAVVRALINAPALLLADEPSGSLDRRSAEELWELLFELNREESLALVAVTHSEHWAARTGRALELRDGALSELAGTA